MTRSLDRPRSRGSGVGPVGRSGPQHPADPLQRVQLVLAALQLGQPGLGQRVDLPASGLLPVHQSLGGQPVQPRVDGAGGRCVQAEEVVLQQADHVVTAARAVAQDAQQVQPELAVTEDALHADGPSAAGAVRSRVTRPRSARAINRPAPPPRVPLAVLPPRPRGPGVTSGNALTISPCTVDSSTFRLPGSGSRTVMSPTRQVSARSVASPSASSAGSARSTMCEPWMQCARTAPGYPWPSAKSPAWISTVRPPRTRTACTRPRPVRHSAP